MKRWLQVLGVLSLLAVCAPSAHAAWSKTQSPSVGNCNSPCSVTTVSTGTGHLLVFLVSGPTGVSISGVTAGACAVAWQHVPNSNISNTLAALDQYYCTSSISGQLAIAGTLSGTCSATCVGFVIEATSTLGNIQLDTGATPAGTVFRSTTCTSCVGVPLTLSGNNNLISVISADGQTASSVTGTGCVSDSTTNGNGQGHCISTGSGTFPATWTQAPAGQLNASAAAFSEGGVTIVVDDTPLTLNLMLMGFGVAALVGRLWGQPDEWGIVPPSLPTVLPEIMLESEWAGFRAFQYTDEDTHRAIPPPPPFAIEDDGEFKFDARLSVSPAIEDDASDKAIPAVIVPFTGTEDGEQNWRIPGPPPYNLEDSAVQPPHRWGSWGGGSTPSQSAAPSTSTDEDQLFSLAPKPTLYDPTSETDEPGLGPTPPVAIQDDDPKWTATASPAIEDDLRSAAPTPLATDLDADPAKLVQPVPYDHTSETDEPGLGPTPPVAIQEDDLYARPVPVEIDEATAAEKTPVIIVTPNIGSDDLDGFFRVGGCVLQGADENADLTARRWGRFQGGGAAPAPAPPQNDQIEWYWADTKRGLSLDPGDADSERFIAPPTPFQATVEEAESKFDAGWKAPAIEEENSDVGITYPGGGGGVGPHRYPRLPEGDDFKFDATWRAKGADDADSYQPPTPPIVPKIELDQSDARDTTVRAFQQQDIDTESDFAPTPPKADDLEIPSMWRAGYLPIEEELGQTPPVAAVVRTAEQDEQGQWTDQRRPAVEEDLSTQVPTPPVAIDQDNLTGPAPRTSAIEDELGQTPPVIVVVRTAEQDDQSQWTDIRKPAIEDDQSNSAVTPPTVVTDDGENKRDAGWRQTLHDDTESQRALPPTPPTVFTDDAELNKRDAGWRQPWHEDTESQRALPPTAPQAIIDDGMFKLDVTWRQFFHDPETYRTVPIVPPFVTTIGRDDDVQIYSGYRATFDTYREVLVFIRNKGRSYFYLLDA